MSPLPMPSYLRVCVWLEGFENGFGFRNLNPLISNHYISNPSYQAQSIISDVLKDPLIYVCHVCVDSVWNADCCCI